MVSDRGDLRKYRTELPNLVDDLKLSVWAYRLYGHLKRVAGDSGTCWQSTRTLADHCRMSVGQVSKAKRELERLELIDRKQSPERKTEEVVIIDIWPENFSRYGGAARAEKSPRGVHTVNTCSPPERDDHPVNAGDHPVNTLPHEEGTHGEGTHEEGTHEEGTHEEATAKKQLQNRWTLESSDDGRYVVEDVIAGLRIVTARAPSPGDFKAAEWIGKETEFSSRAVAALIQDIKTRRAVRVSSLAYFKDLLRELNALCVGALKERASSRVGGDSWNMSLRQVRWAIEVWLLKQNAGDFHGTEFPSCQRPGLRHARTTAQLKLRATSAA